MGNVKSPLQSWWVMDLVHQVADEDRREIREELGYPSVANGFKRLPQHDREPSEIDVGGYSTTEVCAMAQAIEWMRKENNGYYVAIREYMRTRSDSVSDCLYPALVLLGQKVDEIMG